MRCLRCILVFAASCLVCAALAGALTVWLVADWLVRSDLPAPADAIVVLAGAPERPLYAAELYRKKYSGLVLVSRPAQHRSQPLLTKYGVELQREEVVNVALLRAAGTPEAAIELFGEGSQSTVEEMEALKRRFGATPARLLIVTSALHTRRARMVARHVFAGTRIQPMVIATPYDSLPPRWWADQHTARSVVLEVIKIGFYLTGGRFGAAGFAQ